MNKTIAADTRLGRQFCIGHSYVIPTHRLNPDEVRDWFLQVVKTEIKPLLQEYWFDAPEAAHTAVDKLTRDW